MLIGFDVELAQAICKVLKTPCAIQSRPFDTLKAGLADGTGNAILAGFDPERAGAEGLIASQAYLKIPARFVARNEAPFDPNAPPPDAVVSVACGSAHQVFLERFFPRLKLACQPTAAAGLEELKAGRSPHSSAMR
jgi:polar amino acid transport system substrate-binding protein